MAKFRVYFYYEEGGYTEVEAPTKEDAEIMVYDAMENNGTVDFDYEVTHREYDTTQSEEVTDGL